MAFRFWRRIRIAPGVTINLSKSGASLSLGPRGAKYTIGPRGRRVTAGIPGTGLFYTEQLDERDGRSPGTPTTGGGAVSSSNAGAVVSIAAADRLTLGFFRRLVTPDDEKAFVDGCRELALGSLEAARDHLRRAAVLADGSWLAGCLALRCGDLDEAERRLRDAEAAAPSLGQKFARYGIAATVSLPITDHIAAHIAPTLRGTLLARVETHQRQQRREPALDALERLRGLEPGDPIVLLSLVELLMESEADRATLRRVTRLTRGVDNETAVHAGLLLYRGRAMRGLGLPVAARDALTRGLRRRKNRPDELLWALRYERALVYEELGRRSRARSELEKLYAEAGDYEDVAARLDLG